VVQYNILELLGSEFCISPDAHHGCQAVNHGKASTTKKWDKEDCKHCNKDPYGCHLTLEEQMVEIGFAGIKDLAFVRSAMVLTLQ